VPAGGNCKCINGYITDENYSGVYDKSLAYDGNWYWGIPDVPANNRLRSAVLITASDLELVNDVPDAVLGQELRVLALHLDGEEVLSRNSKGCAIVLGGSDWVWIRCLDGGNHDLACPTFAALFIALGPANNRLRSAVLITASDLELVNDVPDAVLGQECLGWI
jgi:hypothetical protein